MNPLEDGINHINIYSKGRTSLGVFLSNFSKCDLQTEDGEFFSVEGYWYWLLSDRKISNTNCPECDGSGVSVIGSGLSSHFGPCPECNRESLRYLSGWQAKATGRKICGKIDYPNAKNENFKEKIKLAINYKIENSPFKEEFIKSTLPFFHYYVSYGKIIVPQHGEWVIEHIENLRKEYGKMSTLSARQLLSK